MEDRIVSVCSMCSGSFEIEWKGLTGRHHVIPCPCRIDSPKIEKYSTKKTYQGYIDSGRKIYGTLKKVSETAVLGSLLTGKKSIREISKETGLPYRDVDVVIRHLFREKKVLKISIDGKARYQWCLEAHVQETQVSDNLINSDS